MISCSCLLRPLRLFTGVFVLFCLLVERFLSITSVEQSHMKVKVEIPDPRNATILVVTGILGG